MSDIPGTLLQKLWLRKRKIWPKYRELNEEDRELIDSIRENIPFHNIFLMYLDHNRL